MKYLFALMLAISAPSNLTVIANAQLADGTYTIGANQQAEIQPQSIIVPGPATIVITSQTQPQPNPTGLNVAAFHSLGQTFLTWREVETPAVAEPISMVNLKSQIDAFEKTKQVRYRVYRSTQPITSVIGQTPIHDVEPFSSWNLDFYGISPQANEMAFRYAVNNATPVENGVGLLVLNPQTTGPAYYAVTTVVNGVENGQISGDNSLQSPVSETVTAQGTPILQRMVGPTSFNFVANATLRYYTRWETPPNTNLPQPFDYLVATNPATLNPAPVGIHMHAWGGNLNRGYGWWFNATKGSMLVSTNQIPYDWWTGYHEKYGISPLVTQADWQSGVVRPYTEERIFSFLDWLSTEFAIDQNQTFTAGQSMGGSGSIMSALRHSNRVAWAVSWVGVHSPINSPGFKSSYQMRWGNPDFGVLFQDGTPVWTYYDDPVFLRANPKTDVGYITFSNGKNDAAIGWPQAREFWRTLQDTKQPHAFVWGQQGHNQRALMPGGVGLEERNNPITIRTNQSVPAFTGCSLDNDPGNGDPSNGDPSGQSNLFLLWDTANIVDQADRWETTIYLSSQAPLTTATVDVTPRRLQALKPLAGQTFNWSNTSLQTGQVVQSGTVVADGNGLITVPVAQVGKMKNRIVVTR